MIPTLVNDGFVRHRRKRTCQTGFSRRNCRGGFFLPAAMMGAPSVAIEKFPKGDEFVRVFEKLGKYLDQKRLREPFQWKLGRQFNDSNCCCSEARHSLGGL